MIKETFIGDSMVEWSEHWICNLVIQGLDLALANRGCLGSGLDKMQFLNHAL